MERAQVEDILKSMGWEETGTIVSSPGNDSKYNIWAHLEYKQKVYLGNYYIEVEWEAVAFPYKDKDTSEKQLRNFLENPEE